MNEKIVTIGIIVILVGGIMGVQTHRQISGGAPMGAEATGVGPKLREMVKENETGKVSVLIQMEPPAEPFSVEQRQANAQSLRSYSVESFTQYGAEFDSQGVIPSFNIVTMEVPLSNVFDINDKERVKSITYNENYGIKPLSSDASNYATTEEIRKIHKTENLPSAENTTVCVIDSGAPEHGHYVKDIISLQGGDGYDVFGHGGAVTKTVHNVAPEADITVVKVLDDQGKSDLSTIVAGIEESVHMRPQPDVINLSIGANPSPISPVDRAVNMIESQYGPIIVSSAGNTGAHETSPATASGSISVGALDEEGDDLTYYSATDYDVTAIGDVDVSGYGELSGTSFASPIVSGMKARWLNYTGEETDDIDAKATVEEMQYLTEEDDKDIITGEKLMSAETVRTGDVYMQEMSMPIGVVIFGLIIAVFGGVRRGN